MKLVLPPYVLACAMVVFGHTTWLKSIGFFFQGFFHIKITLSYTSILDFVPEKSKALSFTLIMAVDAGSPMFACIFFKYYKADEDLLLRAQFWVGAFFTVLYFIFIPESPKWIFMNKGNND